jgi:hypothetical protein
MTRAEEIKQSYVKAGFKEDAEIFKIGTTMLYEWQKDYDAIKYAISILEGYKKYMEGKERTFGQQDPIFLLDALKSRLI